jgi:hypothetical protein
MRHDHLYLWRSPGIVDGVIRTKPKEPSMAAHHPHVVVRPAVAADTGALERLAALDSAPPLNGRVLLAEVWGRPVAALSCDSGAVVADPFERTAALVAMLRLSASAGDRRPARLRARSDVMQLRHA